MTDIFNKLGLSKRHVTALIYAMIVAANKKLGLDISDEMLMTLAGFLGVYIGGESWTKAKATTKTTEMSETKVKVEA